MTHYPAHSRIYHIKADSLDTPKIENSKSHHSSTGHRPTKLKTNVNDVSPSLTGLLAHYNSDSDQEETNVAKPNKLVAKVDDFLQEINQLAPTKVKEQHNKEDVSISIAWQECFDESTGYPYYWNVETNAVTWEMPQAYRDWLTQKSVGETQGTEKTIVQPEKLPVTANNVNTKQTANVMGRRQNNNKTKRKIVAKKTRRPSSDSEDEKIVMITSFSEGSGSESDNDKPSKEETKNTVSTLSKQDQPLVVMGPHVEDIPEEAKHTPTVIPSASDMNKKEIIEPVKEENIDETVILSRLRTQAKVLQELGGELPKSVDKSIICSDKVELSSDNIKPQSLALVASYGDDSEPESEPTTVPSLFPIPNEPKEVNLEPSQSTLFPVTKPIDVKQFEAPVNNIKPQTTQIVPKDTDDDSLLHNKVFKRKKRLGVAFGVPQVKNEKRSKISEPVLDSELAGEGRKGFGFQDEADSNSNETVLSDKPSFKKAGIAFVKADVLNPVEPASETEDDIEDFQEIKDVVSEKVSFLGEGKPPVSPVQVMSIQLQTLEAAYKANGISRRYLYTWLRETFTELGKLEQDAAPVGWQCQWDRSNRRYFYRNQQTGETQWEYPEPDIVGGGEAMDICTTPPPPVNDDTPAETQSELVPPSPPAITADQHSPTPPPPPEITAVNVNDSKPNQPPLPLAVEVPPPPPPPTITVSENQPLPPGVDSPDLPSKESIVESDKSTAKDALGSELDSFYSDIAMLEASNTETVKPDVDNVPSSPTSMIENTTVNDVSVKKKKKSKSKLGQGINMKKKAVSSLVEKWKKVQNDYL